MSETNSSCSDISVDLGKKSNKRARVAGPSYKYINKIDGPGHYVRFVFSAQSLEEANSLLESLHKERIVDFSYVHAYRRQRQTSQAYLSVHGLAHVTSRDHDFYFLRNKIPKANIKVSFYPEGTYPKQTVQVVQTGNVLGSFPDNTQNNSIYSSIQDTTACQSGCNGDVFQ